MNFKYQINWREVLPLAALAKRHNQKIMRFRKQLLGQDSKKTKEVSICQYRRQKGFLLEFNSISSTSAPASVHDEFPDYRHVSSVALEILTE